MRKISVVKIQSELTRINLNGKKIFRRESVSSRDIKRILDIIHTWIECDCTIIYAGLQIYAGHGTFKGRIDMSEQNIDSCIDTFLRDYYSL